eukprot:COSAG06_NODE_1852_length_8164_cov_4.582275_5_plen_43_part_00
MDCVVVQVLPGSHKNNFVRPPGLYGGYGMGSRRSMREKTDSE